MTPRQITEKPTISFGRVLLYVHDIEAVATFYARHFGFKILREEGDRIVELEPASGQGSNIMLHPLAKGRKRGQALAKLVFDCEDVEAFVAEGKRNGLDFGGFHKGEGYQFANTKDPAGNSVSISNRAFRHQAFQQDI